MVGRVYRADSRIERQAIDPGRGAQWAARASGGNSAGSDKRTRGNHLSNRRGGARRYGLQARGVSRRRAVCEPGYGSKNQRDGRSRWSIVQWAGFAEATARAGGNFARGRAGREEGSAGDYLLDGADQREPGNPEPAADSDSGRRAHPAAGNRRAAEA